MERKTWVKPMTLVQKFEANETVAACWSVGCSTGAADDYEKSIGNYDIWYWGWHMGKVEHSIDGCGNPSHQFISDVAGDGKAPIMYEFTDNVRRDCKFYTDGTYKTEVSSDFEVSLGQTVYWTTSGVLESGLYKVPVDWHHQGTVNQTVPGHPNRS